MNEIEMIRTLVAGLPRSTQQENALFEADAEIFSVDGRRLAVTTDEFSEAEDGFSSRNVQQLGWNVVAATISDLVAVGARPDFFLRIVALPPDEPSASGASFAGELMAGVRNALGECGAFLLGGDTSSAPVWRYVGTAIGTFPSGRFITRRAHSERLGLYATGAFGDGNLMALEPGFQASFELRHDFMNDILPLVELAMDSSDGLQNTLQTLAMVNPAYRLSLAWAEVPIHPAVVEFAQRSGLPSEGFLLGSGGEYELVFAVPEAREADLAPLLAARAARIGTMCRSSSPGLFWQAPPGEERPDRPVGVDPRFSPDRQAYIREILSVAKTIFRC